MRQTAFVTIFLITAAFLPAADPTLLNMMMPDAQIVAGVNVSKAETSSFGQYILRSMPADQGFQQFVTLSGFDPRRDLQEILATSNPAAKTTLVLARGTFNAAKIAAAAQATGDFTISTYAGAQLITPAKGKGETLAIVLGSNPSTLALAGDLDSVKGALDRRTAANPVNPVLASKIALYSGADAWTVSIVSIGGLPGIGKGMPAGGMIQADMFKKIQATSGGITFTSPIQITCEAVANTPQDASALGDVIKFAAAMMQTSAPEKGGSLFNTVAKTLDVTTVQNTVKIALSIPESDLENLLTGAGTGRSGVI